MVECEDGYNRSGDSSQYSCGLNGTEVVWMFTGGRVTCSPGKGITSGLKQGHNHDDPVTC